MQAAVRVMGLFVCGCTVGACTITVTPPRGPERPATVYLVDQEHSASLVLPDGARLTRYIYADWHYYALGNRGTSGALQAALLPTQATLARRRIEPAASAAGVAEALGAEVEAIYALRVAQPRAEALVQRLNRAYAAGEPERVYDPDTHLGFVPYPDEPYHLLHNSNTVIARWLRELGCEVNGIAILSRWRVQQPRSVYRPDTRAPASMPNHVE